MRSPASRLGSPGANSHPTTRPVHARCPTAASPGLSAPAPGSAGRLATSDSAGLDGSAARTAHTKRRVHGAAAPAPVAVRTSAPGDLAARGGGGAGIDDALAGDRVEPLGYAPAPAARKPALERQQQLPA